MRFPKMPGLSAARVMHVPQRLDFGSRWSQGIIDQEPPKLGKPYVALVPQVDEFGNELGGIRNVEIAAPLATYTPWALRVGLPGAQDELRDFFGNWLPLSKEGNAQDSRPPLSARYQGKNDYLEQATHAAKYLTKEGYLLEEDIPRVLHRATQTWDWVNR